MTTDTNKTIRTEVSPFTKKEEFWTNNRLWILRYMGMVVLLCCLAPLSKTENNSPILILLTLLALVYVIPITLGIKLNKIGAVNIKTKKDIAKFAKPKGIYIVLQNKLYKRKNECFIKPAFLLAGTLILTVIVSLFIVMVDAQIESDTVTGLLVCLYLSIPFFMYCTLCFIGDLPLCAFKLVGYAEARRENYIKKGYKSMFDDLINNPIYSSLIGNIHHRND